jgi:diguanylate cyclase (GGDEF)-like protein
MRCIGEFKNSQRPAALLMIDIDRFKHFNDTFGHVAGDQALMHTATALREKARQTDVVSRYGGEEFVVVFTAAKAGSVRERAEQLRLAIGQRTLSLGDCKLNVTASAGLAELAPDDSIADWVSRADQALYAAKAAGRDCAFEACDGRFEKLAALAPAPVPAALGTAPSESTPVRLLTESAAELAPEAFVDTTFVPHIARRIAEWRRGGSTLTVVLARLDDAPPTSEGCESDDARSPIRTALQVARVCLREMDVITRWQGDGLAFLLPSTPAADAKNVCRRLRAALAASSTDGTPRVSISIGIAEGIEGNDAKRVLERAWLALEAARSAGCGNIFVHDGIKAVGLKAAAAR